MIWLEGRVKFEWNVGLIEMMDFFFLICFNLLSVKEN